MSKSLVKAKLNHALKLGGKKFASIPESLQIEVLQRLDSKDWTLREAANYLLQHGYPITRRTLSKFYDTYTRVSMSAETSELLRELLHHFNDLDVQDTIKTFVNLVVGLCIRSLLDGKIQIREVDVVKLLAILPDTIGSVFDPRLRPVKPSGAGPIIDQTVAEEIIATMYGDV